MSSPGVAHWPRWRSPTPSESETDYANIIFSFQLAYAPGYVAFGKLIELTPAGSTRNIVTCSNARQADLQIQFNSGSCLPR